MKKISLKFVLGLAVAGLTASTQATLITFDDLPDSPPGLQISSPYNGLYWGNFWELDGVNINAYYGIAASGYANGVVSPNNVAYNFNGNTAYISSYASSTFTLASGYFTGAFNNNLSLEVEGWNGATLLYDQTYTLNVTGPSFISMNTNNITEATFSSFGGVNAGLNYGSGTQFVLDNLSITPVPEPSAWALLCAFGVLAYAVFRTSTLTAKNL
jgi:hypothetical protein